MERKEGERRKGKEKEELVKRTAAKQGRERKGKRVGRKKRKKEIIEKKKKERGVE